MCAFRDALGSLSSLKAQVIAISVDSPFANKGFADANKLTFPILSDYTHEVSKAYCGLYDGFAGLKGYLASKRSVFVLDAQGTVKYVWISENPGVEPPYDDVNKALETHPAGRRTPHFASERGTGTAVPRHRRISGDGGR